MNKNILLLSVLVLSTSLHAAPHKEKTIIICQFCELVHERAYFLLRLERIINLFEMLDKSEHINTNFNEFDDQQYRHSRIKKLILDLENSNSLVPFFHLWNELHEYKHIDDEQLLKEFTKFTLLIIKKLCPTCRTQIPILPDIALDLQNGSYTEAITFRTYFTKRLRKPLALLSRIQCKKEGIFESTINKHPECHCIFESHIRFQHPEITRCISAMENSNSLTPLFRLAKEFERFRLIQDEKFNKEFLLLVFGVYKNLLTHNASHKNKPLKKNILLLIAQLYENLDALPLEQILNAIDLLSEELPQILNEYEIESDMSWKEWLKKYWWVPPIACTTLGIKVYLIFKYAKSTLPARINLSRPGSADSLGSYD